MHDIIFTLITIGLFGLSVVYVAVGERTISRNSGPAVNDVYDTNDTNDTNDANDAKTLTRSG